MSSTRRSRPRARPSPSRGAVTSHANAWSELGRVLLERRELDEASRAFSHALELAKRVDFAVVEVEARWALGDRARPRRSRGRDRSPRPAPSSSRGRAGFTVAEAQAMRTLAWVALASDDPAARASGLADLERSVELLRATQEQDELADGLTSLARALERVGGADLAPRVAAALDEARAIYSSLQMAGRLAALGQERR
ncbi:MAG: hypothetical protein U0271_32110 [Polyangiaceae bacterium]